MAAKTLAFLTYEFLFDPGETFQHVFQFEQELSKFLQSRGLEAEFIESINPKDPKRILYIYKKPVIGEMGKESQKASPQDVIKKYSDPATFKERK